MKKNGGFTLALLPFVPAILSGVSAVTGIAKDMRDIATPWSIKKVPLLFFR